MFRATRLEAVPTGVAIPPIPVPTASAQASGAMGTPSVVAMAAITGMKTVAKGTLSTTCDISAVTHRTRVTERARFPPEIWIISFPSIERTPVFPREATSMKSPPKKKNICQSILARTCWTSFDLDDS